MERASPGDNKPRAALVFGILPCLIGTAGGAYLSSADIIWLSNAGGFWPVVFLLISIASLIRRAVSPFKDRVIAVSAWLALAWTWFHVPLWASATQIPQVSGVVGRDGRVVLTSDITRDPADRVWLINGRAGKKIVSGVAGSATVHDVDIRYDFSRSYTATRPDGEDIAAPLLRAFADALAIEAVKSRTSRFALFEDRAVHEAFVDRVCRSAMPGAITCPARLRLVPDGEATAPGAVWARYHSEAEAISERHVPTLIRLLTDETKKLVQRDLVFDLVMELADSPEDLARVAQNSRLLEDSQFDRLIRKILALPGTGAEAVGILTKVSRITSGQRLALRERALRDAPLAMLCSQAGPLRLTDADVSSLAARMPAAFAKDPQNAVSALSAFGERLPAEVQREAVAAISRGSATHALAALRALNFSPDLRAQLLQKVLSDAKVEDLAGSGHGRDRLDDILTPTEMRALISRAVERSEFSPQWLDFVARMLPARLMTAEERKSILTGMLFASTKAALEYVSENRDYLNPADVSEITRDYTRTIDPDFCLHLSHRNKNRRTEYFGEEQLRIFRDCAERSRKVRD
ncbi:MAG TPA: hypothetical protein VFV47_05890 [Hyphomicrobiaceae bacterium]|nr:hypothetical protein [Hyphomicrobiaceae bacterium]